MSGAIPILTYLWLSYLLTQLIYARTQSPRKCLFLFSSHHHDCVSITKALMMGEKLMAHAMKKYSHKK